MRSVANQRLSLLSPSLGCLKCWPMMSSNAPDGDLRGRIEGVEIVQANHARRHVPFDFGEPYLSRYSNPASEKLKGELLCG
jgi:hypothetical protein